MPRCRLPRRSSPRRVPSSCICPPEPRPPAAADAALDPAVREVVKVIGADVYSTDGRTLERVVGDLLVKGGLRIAAAESCTGGLITSRLTDVPGSSRYVDQSVITYSNAAKTELLGVPPEMIEAHGAVSEPVALAMAEGDQNTGARRRRRRRHGHRRADRRHAGEAGRHGRRRGGHATRAPLSHVPVLRRARAREVSGLAGRARYGQAPAGVPGPPEGGPDVLGMRLFVAVEMNRSVEEAAREVIDDLRERVSRLAPRARITWTSPERLHVTVRFIGEADATRARRSVPRLAPTVDAAAFDVTVEGVGELSSEGSAARLLGRADRWPRRNARGRARCL